MIRATVSAFLLAILIPLTATAQLGEGFYDVELRHVPEVSKLSDGRIRFLINTHVHPDHIGGNAPLAANDVLIFAHDNMRVRMLERRLRFPRGNGGFFPQAPVEARPTAVYDEQWGSVPSWSANDFVPIVYHQLGGGSHYQR